MSVPIQRRTLLLPLLGLLALATLVQPTFPRPVPPAEPDPLVRLNHAFRKAYANNRKAILARADLIIIASGDDLVLLHKDKRAQVKVMPDLYHDLKTIAHVPLALYCLLNEVTGPLTDEQRTALQQYQSLVQKTHDGLEKRWREAKTLPRQQQILDSTLQQLDRVLKSGKSAAEELQAYCRKLAPLTLANADEAAQAQIDAVHTQVSRWRKEINPEEWARLKVIVIGSQAPRRGNVFVQYFARLLGQQGEGPRLVYAEGLWEEPAALRLLGTIQADIPAGKVFYDDQQRLLRDLLADGAARYLQSFKIDP